MLEMRHPKKLTQILHQEHCKTKLVTQIWVAHIKLCFKSAAPELPEILLLLLLLHKTPFFFFGSKLKDKDLGDDLINTYLRDRQCRPPRPSSWPSSAGKSAKAVMPVTGNSSDKSSGRRWSLGRILLRPSARIITFIASVYLQIKPWTQTNKNHLKKYILPSNSQICNPCWVQEHKNTHISRSKDAFSTGRIETCVFSL